MTAEPHYRLAILSPGDRDARRAATSENSRFKDIFAAFAARGVQALPVIYHDDFRDEVREQLLACDGVLVWVNPVQDGRDRTLLDALLREVSAAGVFVSTHPDVILKLGTKAVLHSTRVLGWGCDTHRYDSLEAMQCELPARLASGEARVLKRLRGNGGDGVWRVQLPAPCTSAPGPDAMVRVRHAKRGCIEETLALDEFTARCAAYFDNGGCLIDQAWHSRLPEGMVRCYLVQDRVAGFGVQAINALYPAPVGAPASDAPLPGPRLYHPPTLPEWQRLKELLETDWVPAAQRLLDIDTAQLPILWDCDFLLGPRTSSGEDTYVLCEINVSSVAPYPESAVLPVVEATIARLRRFIGNR